MDGSPSLNPNHPAVAGVTTTDTGAVGVAARVDAARADQDAAAHAPDPRHAPMCFVTIVLNGMPFLPHHFAAFSALPDTIPWSWCVDVCACVAAHEAVRVCVSV